MQLSGRAELWNFRPSQAPSPRSETPASSLARTPIFAYLTPMIPTEHTILWSRIRLFQFDDPTAARPFSEKLAAEQKWSPSFTKDAIEEYRKFLFLCCILENGAAPSATVDQVWHLHLTYTRSYWIDLCKNTLGKDIHHYPSTGGPAEDAKHRQWYKDTLQSYQDIFDTPPPSPIWQPTGLEMQTPVKTTFRWNSPVGLTIIAVALLPFIYIAIRDNTFNPFSLGGPHFLEFFPVFTLSMIACYVIYRTYMNNQLARTLGTLLTDDANVYQLTAAFYGKHRALQAAIVDLVNRSLLEAKDNQFTINKQNYIPAAEDINPLIPAFEAEADGSSYSYDDIMGNWYDQEKFSHPSLENLDRFLQQKEAFLPGNIFPFLFAALAAVRMIQGTLNDRPIAKLITETFVLAAIFFLTGAIFNRRHFLGTRLRKLFTARLQWQSGQDNYLITQYALTGAPAITDMAAGLVLTEIFTAYGAEAAANNTGMSTIWASTGSSSCSSGSSCSGGSSCGGGSSCSSGSSCGGCSGN